MTIEFMSNVIIRISSNNYEIKYQSCNIKKNIQLLNMFVVFFVFLFENLLDKLQFLLILIMGRFLYNNHI
jgi:hypothetical protein